jgi:hypothetical protein
MSTELENTTNVAAIDLSQAKFNFFDLVIKKDRRYKKKYRICDVVVCGEKSDKIGYTLMYEKGNHIYETIYAVAESALIPITDKT